MARDIDRHIATEAIRSTDSSQQNSVACRNHRGPSTAVVMVVVAVVMAVVGVRAVVGVVVVVLVVALEEGDLFVVGSSPI